LAGIRLGDIQVVNDPSGWPEIVLHGSALARLGAVGGARVHVSLTHEGENAIAIAIIEG
jgi:holo-[acyl-carrier protein] synthase